MVVAVLIITLVLAYFNNLNTHYQNHIQQITKQLEQEQEKAQRRRQLEHVQALQKQASIQKAKEAADLAAAQAAQAAQQAPQSAPDPQVTYPTNCAAYEPLVAQYNWPVHTMMAIMQAESSCNPMAYNPSGCYGLFQVNGNGAVYDPAQNVAVAYGKYASQGLSAWTAYSSGAYLRYL